MNDRITRRMLFTAAVAALSVAPAAAIAQTSKKSTPKKPSRPRTTRPPASRPASPPPAAPPPWPDPEIKTVSAALERLAAIPARTLTNRQVALATALRFCAAIGRADGPAAAEPIDAVGYQKLPLAGPLSELPEKPVPAKALAEEIARFRPAAVGDVALSRFRIETPFSIETQHPAVAAWALESDLVIVIDPEPGVSGWIQQRACIVVRLRGGRPTIIGGNLFDAYRPAGAGENGVG